MILRGVVTPNVDTVNEQLAVVKVEYPQEDVRERRFSYGAVVSLGGRR